MSGFWARIGRVGAIAVQIILVAAGIATIAPFVGSYVNPSTGCAAPGEKPPHREGLRQHQKAEDVCPLCRKKSM